MLSIDDVYSNLSNAEQEIVHNPNNPDVVGRNSFLPIIASQIGIIGDHQEFIINRSSDEKIRKSKLTVYINTQRFYSNLKKYLSFLVGDASNPKILLSTGDKCSSTSIKGYISLPRGILYTN